VEEEGVEARSLAACTSFAGLERIGGRREEKRARPQAVP